MRFATALAHELEQVEVELRALLGQTTMTIDRLQNLEVGEVILLNSDETAPLTVLVEGRHKLSGQPRVQRGAMAIELIGGVIPPSDTQKNEAA
jgi:flagellar motor switch protein FliM